MTPQQSRRTVLLSVGVLLWVVACVWNWPAALSFGDEVGYLGQARLFLEGHVRPSVDSPGIWHTTAEGSLIAKYPLFHPALLAPFIAIAPRSAFLLGVISAILLVACAARLLKSWGKDPLWALLVLVQPAICVVSRTLMADLLLSSLLFAGYLSLKRPTAWVTAGLFAVIQLTKPTGPLLTIMLICGECLTHWKSIKARDLQSLRPIGFALLGFAIGMLLVGGLNILANGTPQYGYHERFGPPSFGFQFLSTAGAAHAKSLLLNPPLLILGALPFWKRREFGPLAVIAGLISLMSIYYFVDWGRNWLDSLVLSQRLILPAIAFLMAGYASLLCDLFAWASRRWGRWISTVSTVGLVLIPGGVGQVIGARHLRWQKPMNDAMMVVNEVSASQGTKHIALTPNALKYGLLFRGRTSMYVPDHENPDVILCATKNTSYRISEVDLACEFPGYRRVRSVIGSDVLVRADKAATK